MKTITAITDRARIRAKSPLDSRQQRRVRHSMVRENKKKFAGAIAGLLITSGAHADVAYEVEAGAGTSDNITRVATDEIDETLASLGLTLDWQEQSRRIN